MKAFPSVIDILVLTDTAVDGDLPSAKKQRQDSIDGAGAVAFGAATAAAAGLGFLLDMSALQRFDATRAAPPMFVLETAIPVLLAPWLFGEHWGAFVGVGLVLVLGGGAMLGASRAVAGLEDEAGRGGT